LSAEEEVKEGTLFTGIIEEIGTVRQVTSGSAGQLLIAAQTVLEDTRLGDSIAVNGVCLTVTRLDSRTFAVDVMPQTLRQSNLGLLHVGSQVNLERAVTPSSRLGGHLVQGHADGVGEIVRTAREENALWVTIAAPVEVMRYVVPRAFIAVDGASLTVARAEAGRFSVSLIPHTQTHITLPQQPTGYAVNLEVDIVAKYVERLLQGGQDGKVDWESLAQHGFS
jgi:riboflavin synthase